MTNYNIYNVHYGMNGEELDCEENRNLCRRINRIRNLERHKTIFECLEILRFHRDKWDGIEWAIRDIEELNRKE